MKQHITRVQLDELSDEQKERLRKLWNPKYGDAYYYPKVNSTGNVPNGYRNWEIDDMKTRVFPLLSIGQMIELIESKTSKIPSMEDHKGFPLVAIFTDRHHEWIKEELCDALWEAVKQVLADHKGE